MQSGAIRVYSIWHASVPLKSTGWRGTTLDVCPAGKLSCEQLFGCEMGGPHTFDTWQNDITQPAERQKAD